MSNITVKLYTLIKEKAGTGSIELDSPNLDDAADAIRMADEKLGNRFREALYDTDGKIRKYYILVLNGRTLNTETLDRYKLKDGDVLHIFPPIAGG